MRPQIGRLVTLVLLGWAGTVRAQDSDPDLLHVTETRWGFDGTIQQKTFTPFSAHVQNVSPNPWQGRLRLTRWAGISRRFGAPLEVEVSLQPDEGRWVQFVPYLVDDLENWTLAWGPHERHRIEMTSLNPGPPPTVLIFDRDAVTPPGGVLRRMPEELFPNSVTATDGLRGVVLNRPPFWQGARARAFIEWLTKGGRVYLLHDEQGRFPQFAAPLGVLNDARERFDVGAGVVRRIPRKVEQIDLSFARRELFNDDWPDALAIQASRQPAFQRASNSSGAWFPDRDIFVELAPLIEFHRRWWLIYLAVLAYLAALFPGCYSIGVREKKVRRFYSVFFATAALFSLLFIYLGELGASAQNRIRSVALAHSLGEGTYDVTQWSYLANVNRGDYTLRHAGSGLWYSTCQEIEAVDGLLTGGADGGQVELRMPPASTRTLLHRSRISTGRPVPKLVDVFTEGGALERCTVSVAGSLESRILKGAAVFRGMVYDLQARGGQLELDRRQRPQPLPQFLDRPSRWNQDRWGIWREKEEEFLLQSRRYERLLRPLTGNSFGLKQEVSPRLLGHVPAPSEQQMLRVLIYTPMTSEFFAEADRFPDQQGCVLYCYDFPVSR